MPKACLILIGNELLSGRTQDQNLAWLARKLGERGIRLTEARVIPDIEATIVETVNTCRPRFDYIFTTGGIGPTHDDITAAAIAKAFGVKIERNKEVHGILEKHYGDKLNDARLKMADIPEGASLIGNPVSGAPGFIMENVYVMAGVPSIMRAMFEAITPSLKGGAVMHAKAVSAYVVESSIAQGLSDIQDRYPETEIGSYPFMRERLGVCLIARGTDAGKVDAAYQEIKAMLEGMTDEVIDGDLAA